MKGEHPLIRRCDQIIDGVYKVTELLCKLIFLAMIFSIAAAVFGRFVLRRTPPWSEEIGILCLVWLCFLTAQLAVRDGNHIRMTILEYVIPEKAAKVLHVLAYLVILAINILWITAGAQVMELSMTAVMPSTQLSMACTYAATVSSGVIGVLMVAGRIIRGNWQ